MPSIRTPAVAGAFYTAHPERLRTLVADLLPRGARRRAAGVLVPHAGYVYSGAAAGATYARVELPATVVLLGPNHTGRGAALAAAEEEEWLTPLGKLPVDRAFLEDVAAAHPDLAFDRRAHAAEHSLEVQLPFLQALRPGVAIAPIVLGTQDLAALVALGVALARAVRGRAEPPLLVISSDMSHYIPARDAAVKDRLALERLAAVDPEGLHRTVLREAITMCGLAPAVAALAALRELHVARGEEVVYTHSGVVTGDTEEVVAYAGMVFAA